MSKESAGGSRRIVALLCANALLLTLGACAPSVPAAAETPPAQTVEPAVFALELAPEAEASFTPAAPTPASDAAAPLVVTIGAAGDVSMTQRQLAAAYDSAAQRYDFSEAFTGVAALFQSVDLMCVNLETPLAGRKAGYSGGASGKNNYGSFNAPDSLAACLRSLGVDAVTTANNHFLDRGADGVFATLDALDAAELPHTGTFRSVKERETSPLVLDAGGVKVGLVACTSVFNDVSGFGRYELSYLVSRAADTELLSADIARCREAGAEFVIVFAHWDEEYAETPAALTREAAKTLLSLGADAVLGAHPHTVQPFEYVTVERNGGSYTGLVAYSLGNCLLRMSELTHNGGLFVRLRLQKTADGAVSLLDASYLPLAILSTYEDGREYVETLACYEDAARMTHSARLTDAASRAATVAAHITQTAGTDVVPLMH